MANNVLQYASVFQSELDKAAVEQATSGWMELNSKLVKYEGGSEVKIPQLDMDGLADYDRQNGFVEGTINLTWQTKTMTMDRGRQFTFDEQEVNDTNFVLTASTVMGEFQRTKVVPEIDAYRYSRLAALAAEKGRAVYGYTPEEGTILKQLYTDIAAIQDEVGDDTPLVITMATPVAALFDLNTSLARSVAVADFQQGGINLKVKSINGQHPIIRAGSGRLKTAYQFNDGTTDEQKRAASPLPRVRRISTGLSAPGRRPSRFPAQTRCVSLTRRPTRKSGPGPWTTASTTTCGCWKTR